MGPLWRWQELAVRLRPQPSAFSSRLTHNYFKMHFNIMLLRMPAGISQVVRFEVFTAVIMKNGVFWDVTPCGSCKNQRFGGT
jgi:hypothetical protein